MTQTDNDCYIELIAQLIARQDQQDAINTQLGAQLAAQQQQFDSRLRSVIQELETIAASTQRNVIFAEQFPTTYKMVTGQLFHNPPNNTGKHGGHHPCEWRMKVCFWTHSTDIAMYEDGTVQPYYFNLHPPTAVAAKQHASMLAECLASTEMELIGCREIKGTGNVKGTRLNENLVVAVMPSSTDGCVSAWKKDPVSG
jgi:hypothetical protein